MMGYSFADFQKDMDRFKQTGNFPSQQQPQTPWWDTALSVPVRAVQSVYVGVGKGLERFHKAVGGAPESAPQLAIREPMDTGARWGNIAGDIGGELIPAAALELATLGIAPAFESFVGSKLPSLAKWGSALTPTKQKLIRGGVTGSISGGLSESGFSYSRGEETQEIAKHAAIGTVIGGGFGVLGEAVGMGLKRAIPKLTGEAATSFKSFDGFKSVKEATESADNMAIFGRTGLEDLGDMSQIKQLRQAISTFTPDAQRTMSKLTSRIDEGLKAIDTNNMAKRIVADDPGMAMDIIKQSDALFEPEAYHVAAELVKKHVVDKNIDGLHKVFQEIGQKNLDIPVLQLRNAQLYSLLDEDTVIPYTQKLLKEATKKSDNAVDKLSKAAEKDIKDRLLEIKKMPTGTKRNSATLSMMAKMVENIPVDMWRKIDTAQVGAMLSNPVTHVRNLISNTVYSGTYNITSIPEVGLDILTSLFTGTRTKTLNSIFAQAGGAKQGFKVGFDAVFNGVQLGKSGKDIVNSKVFENSILAACHKALGMGLEIPDQMFYMSRFNNELLNQMKIAGVNKPTLEMIQVAHAEGLEGVFRSERPVIQMMENLRSKLNKISTLGMTEQFGAGSVLLRFIKTPMNLGFALLDHSPVGILNGCFQMVKPMFGGKFDQRAFVKAMSKGAFGTSTLMGLGYWLNGLGVLTGGGEWDNTADSIRNQQGMGKNRFNMSGLFRLVSNGFQDPSAGLPQKGDKIITYNWFEPVSAVVSLGASAKQAQKDARKAGEKLGTMGMIAAAAEGAIGSFNEDGFVGRFLNVLNKNYYDEGDSSDWFWGRLKTIASEVPASFIPNLLSGLRKAVDNNQRKTFDENFATRAKNLMMNKIPYMSQNLDKKYTRFGEVMQYYPDDTNAMLSVLLNPSALNYYSLTKEQDFLLNLYEILPKEVYEKKEDKQRREDMNKILKALGKKTEPAPFQARWMALPAAWGTIRNPDGKSVPYEMTDDEKIRYQKFVNDHVIANINTLTVDKTWAKADEKKKLEMIYEKIKKAGEEGEKKMQIELFGYAYQTKSKSKKDKKVKTTKYTTVSGYKRAMTKNLSK